ncbi:hypothetical protein DEAC_c30340 [Desulfosporosinus acididurans]|uniref:6-hydroxymethylpterin diphosphokinase MptE-like domain-containing protein n=1 Tax=Desulfosporosinus acididurans TaxID=476652 RepID=A0A0J1FP33_9FIRM|nr:6-hydroxymethylpterin diphosphokinase MptE-like protein [Desulfosporosinus acididurans]KLU65067.1 hypothetical protein DEAC_c30340 [Desulfosporosinus acididurans]
MDEVIKLKDGRVLRFFKAKNGQPTLTVNEMLLHSKYDPGKEAVAFIDHNQGIYQDKDSVAVYGLGLGYHVRELLKRIGPACRVFLFEPDQAFVKKVRTREPVQQVLSDQRVTLIEGYNYDFLSQFAEKLKYAGDLLIYKPSLRILPGDYEDLKNVILDFEMGKISIQRHGASLKENSELNQRLDYNTIEDYLNHDVFADKPVVIVSAGPSLDLVLEELLRYRSQFRLFCVGSALRTLMNHNIIPDMICIIDAQDIVAKQFSGYENLDIPLCFLSTASHLALANYLGPKYIFYNQPKQGNITIETGMSVATALLSIALKGKASPIIFVGQDLAFINNQHHTNVFTEIYGASNDAALFSSAKVLGVNGELLDTNSGLLSYKRWIERTIAANPQVIFINASKGAKIKGTIEKNLDEIFNGV